MTRTVNTAILSYSFSSGSDVQNSSFKALEPNVMEPLNRGADHDADGTLQPVASRLGLFESKRNDQSSLFSEVQKPAAVATSRNPTKNGDNISLEASTMGILNSTGTFYAEDNVQDYFTTSTQLSMTHENYWLSIA